MASRVSSRLQTLTLAAWNSLRTMGRRESPAMPRRILIAHHLLLGDTLMLTPLLAKLRRQHPQAELVMATPKAIAPLYAKHPYGVTAIPFDPHDSGTLKALRRRGGYDLAIVPGDNRYSWLALALGARWIVAFDADRPAYKNWPVDETHPYPDTPATWGDMVAGLIPGLPPSPYEPSDWQAPQHAAFELPRQPYCVLHVGASSPLKQWPADRWSALATHLAGAGFQIVWSGGKGESSLVAAADPETRHPSFAGQLDLPQLWQLIRHAALLVCPDTGIAHLGRIVGTPTMTLFGPGSDVICGAGSFWQNAPYRAMIARDIPCRNQKILFRREIAWVQRCGRSTSECAVPKCMHAISLEAVSRTADEMLLANLKRPAELRPLPHASDGKICYQFNFSTSLGGAEIYTQFFSKALQAKGWKTVLYINSKADFWAELNMPGVELISLTRREDLPHKLPDEPCLIVTHTPLPTPVSNLLRQKHTLTGIIHHPIYGGNGEPYRAYQLVFAVSRHVIATLEAAGIHHYDPEPWYGVADMDRLMRQTGRPIEATPMYDWDKRKLRDRLLRVVYPLYWKLKPTRHFKRRPGLTLGIVSRIADAKQFPALFKVIGPIIKRHPEVHVEIFGSSVGYASIKRLKRGLQSIQGQVRFWGPQTDLSQVYHSMDFLLAGLPEREAMGLNILEAQFCGTPVLAVNASPFSEIIQDRETGFLFTDPRLDGGQNFEQLLNKLLATPARPNPMAHREFLDSFTFDAFASRVDRALSSLPLQTAQA